jgi:hypothetical protein
MRLAVLFALITLAAPATATAQTPTLDSIAADALVNRYPANLEAAPAAISIRPELADALRAEPLPGGQEKTLYFALDDGVLTLRRSIAGARYRASGVCLDCSFRQPISGHTHPYENPFSVIDLEIAAGENRPSLMVARNGQIWLALPTRARPKTGRDPRAILRYAMFGNRLECPAITPPGGWASTTVMGRRVEAVARTAAVEFGLALYVADPGQDFRRVEGLEGTAMPPPNRIRDVELNPYERSLARLLHAAAFRNNDGWPEPTEPFPALDAFFAEQAGDPSGGLDRLTNGAAAHSNWFSALPTTMYLTPFDNLEARELRFVSVQNSADCTRLMVLQGRQTFEPDGVVYEWGWSRDLASTAPVEEGWDIMTAAEMPTGQVVPW